MIREGSQLHILLELGSDTYLCQETLYQSESCRRRLRKTAPYGPPGMATKVCPALSPTLLAFLHRLQVHLAAVL